MVHWLILHLKNRTYTTSHVMWKHHDHTVYIASNFNKVHQLWESPEWRTMESDNDASIYHYMNNINCIWISTIVRTLSANMTHHLVEMKLSVVIGRSNLKITIPLLSPLPSSFPSPPLTLPLLWPLPSASPAAISISLPRHCFAQGCAYRAFFRQNRSRELV